MNIIKEYLDFIQDESAFKNIIAPDARELIATGLKQARKMFKDKKISKAEYIQALKYFKGLGK